MKKLITFLTIFIICISSYNIYGYTYDEKIQIVKELIKEQLSKEDISDNEIELVYKDSKIFTLKIGMSGWNNENACIEITEVYMTFSADDVSYISINDIVNINNQSFINLFRAKEKKEQQRLEHKENDENIHYITEDIDISNFSFYIKSNGNIVFSYYSSKTTSSTLENGEILESVNEYYVDIPFTFNEIKPYIKKGSALEYLFK
ncbi:hypothetical protein OFR22_12420 [Brachyspira hyodysenteriae]|uniref:hypothetical protein n=1 Tax=Brachyspira hyodysenteriae TaxID=159 RepID=UPI0022CD725C|nr:hypothetical protein [Brachyspira hyodysenteriae]MCZ9851678.1 hypothetical protein [Brachyspira hyodysenteriae]MCZ9859583.1 hypothetical protein [Brachyspira hyodysenteriae]MCZ9870187.1 hypothetical protein [Brachyspira hyodysenteriae]MCZ9878463.1 hypothetical protein [Brachyspira hyodysenteriae]MCZ9893504.1 hypothetical protein [Brachyspira hyodysenteriae]